MQFCYHFAFKILQRTLSKKSAIKHKKSKLRLLQNQCIQGVFAKTCWPIRIHESYAQVHTETHPILLIILTLLIFYFGVHQVRRVEIIRPDHSGKAGYYLKWSCSRFRQVSSHSNNIPVTETTLPETILIQFRLGK